MLFFRSSAADVVGISVSNECNVDCRCSTEQFIPVCGTHNDITYFSPCHAGCAMKNEQVSLKTRGNYLPIGQYDL